ncbi:bacteriophage abortive infection AbiH family protein [Blautia faecis]|uniref:bacteriophage abortive infection AbiH family protein n=1 Tax=Blautia faecis TaxID=871665 RepID=UPI001D097555|nr:bacteriophage abortive infection AbiH family protein [Blautia faecis]MCB6580325.1 bacteriophage abortive infection AbiH family protein [Blautia faecis]MCB7292023.1 bacteriophage abortive infection AbiH family protein [Blautia faecis]
MLFDKNLFESKYVPAEQRTPVDTLILIGNGFDIWQNLDTRVLDPCKRPSSIDQGLAWKYRAEQISKILKGVQ